MIGKSCSLDLLLLPASGVKVSNFFLIYLFFLSVFVFGFVSLVVCSIDWLFFFGLGSLSLLV